jgi:hypothetical protein
LALAALSSRWNTDVAFSPQAPEIANGTPGKLRLSFPSLPELLLGTSSREWRDACWKVSQGHLRILSETALSRRKSLRTIRTSLLCRSVPASPRLALLLLSAGLVSAGLSLGGTVARAQNATWNNLATVAGPSPGTFDFNASANWNTSAVPTGTAFFNSSTTPNLSFSSGTTIGGWTFNAGASAYTFTNTQLIDFVGAGIVIDGGSASLKLPQRQHGGQRQHRSHRCLSAVLR